VFPDKLFDRSGDMRVVAEELLHVAGHVVLSPYQNVGRYDRKRRCATTTPANIPFFSEPRTWYEYHQGLRECQSGQLS